MPRAVPTAAHRARRGGAAGGPGRGGVRVFHGVSSPADPDQADGHEPRPSVTIRQRSRLAAMVGPTTRLQAGRPVIAQPTAQPQGRCAIGLRNRPAQPAWGSCAVESRWGGCAVRPGLPDLLLRRSVSRTAQASVTVLPASVCASVSGPCGRAACDRTAVAGPGNVCRTRWPAARSRQTHGRGHGRPDHDPDHGRRVPIVTMVGGSWSVVRSGSTGFLKVSNYTS